jgi:hypothetical protein
MATSWRRTSSSTFLTDEVRPSSTNQPETPVEDQIVQSSDAYCRRWQTQADFWNPTGERPGTGHAATAWRVGAIRPPAEQRARHEPTDRDPSRHVSRIEAYRDAWLGTGTAPASRQRPHRRCADRRRPQQRRPSRRVLSEHVVLPMTSTSDYLPCPTSRGWSSL